MKRKAEGGMRQSALRLPDDLIQRLKKAAGGHSMGEEIRRRLEASFAAEKESVTPATQDLLDEISHAARETGSYYGDWSEDAFAFEVLRTCVDLLLAASRPKGEAVPRQDHTEIAELLFAPDHSPKDISRVIVGELLSARAKRASPTSKK